MRESKGDAVADAHGDWNANADVGYAVVSVRHLDVGYAEDAGVVGDDDAGVAGDAEGDASAGGKKSRQTPHWRLQTTRSPGRSDDGRRKPPRRQTKRLRPPKPKPSVHFRYFQK